MVLESGATSVPTSELEAPWMSEEARHEETCAVCLGRAWWSPWFPLSPLILRGTQEEESPGLHTEEHGG